MSAGDRLSRDERRRRRALVATKSLTYDCPMCAVHAGYPCQGR